MRQPTEHVVQVLSTCSRSHGRALKRYGVAVSAPTGQICTVLPEKYDAERLVGERHHLRLVAALGEVDQRVAGDLVGEAGAAVAQDAALAVEQHEVADRDRLLEVPLLLDVAALARTVAERLVLQRALAALVADRAVERVVGEQQLDDALLGPLRSSATRCRPSCRARPDHARRRQLRTATAVDLDEAHAAHADRAHPLVVAEPRDVLAVPLGGGDDQLALAGRDRSPLIVIGDGVRIRLGIGGRRRSAGGAVDRPVARLGGLRGARSRPASGDRSRSMRAPTAAVGTVRTRRRSRGCACGA